ncbi:MAG: GAF domain-containing protein [Syntrophobacterales bacterium]|jgi:GGDEF domain-containing protein|nr:GAF domain-containing protein [Syntrophobacterales bacterium]
MIDHISQLIFNVYEAFTVALFLKEKEMLKCASSVTFATSFSKSRAIPVESTLPGWALKHNEPLIIPNFDKDEATLGYYGAKENIKSFMTYPVETDGVIVVDSKKKYVFTDREKKILGSFASIMHKEIEREKRFQDMEDRIEDLAAEKRIMGMFSDLNAAKISARSIMSEALALSGADFCFVGMEKGGRIFIYDACGIAAKEYVKKECPLRESIVSLVMEGGGELLLPHNSGYLREKPLFFAGESVRTRQFFGFPLMVEDFIVGVMGFGSLSDLSLKEGSIALLRNVSSLLSLHYAYLWMRDHLEKVKEVEPVTGSIQFATFLGILEKMIKKGNRFYLLSVKLPHLHVYNKKMGFDYTNGVLARVAKVIKYCAGNNAFITRKGGGDFYAAVRGGDEVEIKNLTRILNHTIRKRVFEEKAWDVDSAVESGAACFPEDGTELWTLIEKSNMRRIKTGVH